MNEALDIFRAGMVLLHVADRTSTVELRNELRARGFAVVDPRHVDDVPICDVAVVVASQRPDGGRRLVGQLRDHGRPVVWVAPLELQHCVEARRRGVVLFYPPVDVATIADAVDRVTSR